METRNAIIEAAEITNDDHGLLTAWLYLRYDGSSQGFGGLSLYLPKTFTHHELLSPAGHWIWRVMEIAEVTKWSQLDGKTIRVKQDNARVHEIGHIIKNNWFNPEKEFEKIRKGKTNGN